MRGHVAKKGKRYYVVLDMGVQPSRRCSTCRRAKWTAVPGELACEKCGSPLEAPEDRRRREWRGGVDGGFAKQKEAKDELACILGERQRGISVDPTRQTFGEFVEEWLSGLQLRPSTIHSYGRNLRVHVVPTLGGVRLQQLDPGQLTALYRNLEVAGHQGHRKGEGLSPRTVRYVHTIIHRALKDAVKMGRLYRNPADAADPPRARDAQEASPEMVTWTPLELADFLEWARPDLYGPAFHFAAFGAVRRGELLGLRWSDVDLDSDPAKVSIRRTLIAVGHKATDGHTKTARPRVIELDEDTVAVLRQQRVRQAEHRLAMGVGYQGDLVFCHPDGRPFHPERFSREFDRKLERYNREHPDAPLPRIRLHDLRHTWATLALKAGEHPKVVAERLGHANTNVTLNVYSHVVEGMQAGAAERVAALVRRSRLNGTSAS